MKTLYEYDIAIETYGKQLLTLPTREFSRQEKKDYEEVLQEIAKIIQRKYILAEEKVVR